MQLTDAVRRNLAINDVHRLSSLEKLYCPVKSEVRQAENWVSWGLSPTQSIKSGGARDEERAWNGWRALTGITHSENHSRELVQLDFQRTKAVYLLGVDEGLQG